jgi:hypothetical protein
MTTLPKALNINFINTTSYAVLDHQADLLTQKNLVTALQE